MATGSLQFSPGACDSRFQGGTQTANTYNKAVQTFYNPSLRAVAARHGAAVADAWGLYSSYPELQAIVQQKPTAKTMNLHPHCEEQRQKQKCGNVNNSELSLALAAQLKQFFCSS